MQDSLESIVAPQSAGNGLLRHGVLTAAICTVSHPVHAALETALVRMTDWESLQNRGVATLLLAGGITSLYGWGRRYSMRQQGLFDDSPDELLSGHDRRYGMAFCAALTPPLLSLMKWALPDFDVDGVQIAVTTLLEGAYGAMAGAAVGKAFDLFEEAAGLRESLRLPACFTNRTRSAKRWIAGGLFATSLLATAAIYAIVPDSWQRGWSRIEEARTYVEYGPSLLDGGRLRVPHDEQDELFRDAAVAVEEQRARSALVRFY